MSPSYLKSFLLARTCAFGLLPLLLLLRKHFLIGMPQERDFLLSPAPRSPEGVTQVGVPSKLPLGDPGVLLREVDWHR